MTVVVLEVVEGPAAGKRLELTEPLMVGREGTGEGSLGGDPQLSRRHAKVSRFEGGRLLIEDLGSTNGTFVNGEPIAGPTVLSAGDSVALGDTTLRVVTEPTAAEAAPAAPEAAPPAPAAGPAPDLSLGGTHKLPSDLLGLLIARAPVQREWIVRAAAQSLVLILAINFIIRTIAVEYLDVPRDVSVMKPHVLFIVSVMPVIGNSLGFYENFGRPASHSPLRYLIPGFFITGAICTVELITLPASAGFPEHAVTVLISLVAPSIVTPTMLGLRVRAALTAEARLRRARA